MRNGGVNPVNNAESDADSQQSIDFIDATQPQSLSNSHNSKKRKGSGGVVLQDGMFCSFVESVFIWK